MRHKCKKSSIFSICLINILLFSKASSQSVLPEALQMDLKRVEETWKILDRYAEEAWPGWKNCDAIPFQLDYPNGLSLHIGQPANLGKFKLIESITLRGKKIFLDDSRINSLTISPRLTFGGGGAGVGNGHPTMRVRRALITKELENKADSLMRNLGSPSWPSAIVYSTDNTIFGLTHELFHCFTDFGAMFWTGDTLFEADLNYAVFAEIEGNLLEKAAFESDSIKMKDYLEKSLVAREMKRRSMSDRQKTYESDREKCEGTAEYAAYRIVQFLKSGYEASLSHKDDPLYFGFRYSDYFPAMRLYAYHESFKNTHDAGSKCYANGFFKCLILDKLLPQWKTDFFEKKKSFDDLITQFVNLKEGNTSSLLGAIKKEYRYETLLQRHSPVIAERDSTIHYFQNSRIEFYVLNIKEMGLMPNITSSGTPYWHGLQCYYSSGITDIQVGDMTYNSKGVPLYYDIATRSIKLPDLDSPKDGQRYDLKYSRLDTDSCYYDVTITSKSFTMHATKLQIIKSPSQVEFRILPAVK